MIILFEVFDLHSKIVQNFIDEAKKYGDVCMLHPCNELHTASFFLAFGGVELERVVEKIKRVVPINEVECFKIAEYYGDCDENIKEWLKSYIH